jgi:hypothetical protein
MSETLIVTATYVLCYALIVAYAALLYVRRRKTGD